jgi:hypothetical protein
MFRTLRLWIATSVIVLIALGGATSSVWAADIAFDPAAAKSPPLPRNATVELLSQPTAGGNAILRVQFDTRRGKAPLVIQGAAGPTLLRDDGVAPDDKAGDGRHAAVVRINLGAFTLEQRRRIALARQVKTVPVFDLRELRGLVPFQPSPVERLKPGIPNLLDDFRGVPLEVDWPRELLIRDPLVVEDPARTYNVCDGTGTPMGAWTFGRLMTEIANEPATRRTSSRTGWPNG